MSMITPLFGDLEKLPIESNDPTVFKKPNTSSKVGMLNVSYSQPFEQKANNGQHWCQRYRSIVLLIFLLFFSVVMIAGCVFVVFLRRYDSSTMQPAFLSGASELHTSSTKFDVNGHPVEITQTLYYLESDGTLVIAMDTIKPYSTTYVLHSFHNKRTIIRTPHRCYLRPMREDMLEAYHNNYVNKINDRMEMKEKFRVEIMSEQFSATEIDEVKITSFELYVCKGFPTYILATTLPPTKQTLEYDGFTQSSDYEGSGSGDNNGDLPNSAISPSRIRQRRSIPLSDTMHVKSDQLPKVYEKSDNLSKCWLVDDVLEDFILPPASSNSSSTVKVTHDVIMKC